MKLIFLNIACEKIAEAKKNCLICMVRPKLIKALKKPKSYSVLPTK